MTAIVSIVDYGIGNIFSVSRALEFHGAAVKLVKTPDEVVAAERLILPGVGAFANGMQGLEAGELVEPLRAFVATGRPFLGICLGMQLLVDASHEFGEHRGLGLIPGTVEAIRSVDGAGQPIRVPHIGWTPLRVPADRAAADGWRGTLLEGIEPGSETYFVHSFAVQPSRSQDWLAEVHYGDQRICAALSHQNVTGCQFHPEKSGTVGLSIMGNFLKS